MSRSVTQCTCLSTQLDLQMFIAMSHWSDLRPLASATLSILDYNWTLLRYPEATLCFGDHVALVLEDQSLHALQHFIDVADVGVGQLKALDLNLGGS